jgi:hypothetical protein
VTARTAAVASLLSVAVVAGTLSDRPAADPPLTIAGYRVLAGDFHVHPAIVSAAAVAPWDLVLDARRQHLDVVAITPHNAVFGAKIGRWFARRVGGPRVLVGEEIRGWSYHLVGLGIERSIPWTRDVGTAIDAVHAQGGVAILAHPKRLYWPSFDAPALAALDGAEVVHPMTFAGREARREFREFYARRPMTAIGSSDFHGFGRLGMARTYLFVKGDGDAAVLEALRERRTVVYDADGSAFGDPTLVRAARVDGRLPARERDRYAALHGWEGGALGALSRIAGVIGLTAASLFFYRRGRRER